MYAITLFEIVKINNKFNFHHLTKFKFNYCIFPLFP